MKFRNRVISLISISVLVLITFKLFGSKRDKNNVQPLEVRDHSDKKEENITELVNKYSINFDSEIKDWPWNVAAGWVKPREVHPQDTPEMGAILNAMATAPIISADVGYKGTQLKLLLLLKGGQRVAFKPKWYRRETVVKGSPYSGRDRHNGEIAAFHLNRILEFRRAPLVVGRRVDLKTDIMPVATEKLLSTFFEKDENTCFYGKCLYCRGPEDGVCAEGTRLEGIVILWLPSQWRLQPFRHPWSRTYRTNKLARWETEEDYCESVQQMALYQSGPRLLDILDSAVFDYLIGNADRHHYEAFKDDPEAMLILMDSAKSFGNPYIDERTILAPVYQCCRLRRQTWDRLLVLRDGVLSQVLQRILKNEPIAPILTKPHFEAIDRRLTHVFKEMQNCFDSHGKRNVLIDE